MLTGGMLGFLFGIPKYVSSGQARFDKKRGEEGDGKSRTKRKDDKSQNNKTEVEKKEAGTGEIEAGAGKTVAGAGETEAGAGKNGTEAGAGKTPRFEPSTNLAEVSDWLTKVLLGAGLVQLTQLSEPAVSLINSVAAGPTGVTPPRWPSQSRSWLNYSGLLCVGIHRDIRRNDHLVQEPVRKVSSRTNAPPLPRRGCFSRSPMGSPLYNPSPVAGGMNDRSHGWGSLLPRHLT